MATVIRDGAVLATVAAVHTESNLIRVYVPSATYRRIPVNVHDGIFIYVNPHPDHSIERLVGDTVRHLAGV